MLYLSFMEKEKKPTKGSVLFFFIIGALSTLSGVYLIFTQEDDWSLHMMSIVIGVTFIYYGFDHQKKLMTPEEETPDSNE